MRDALDSAYLAPVREPDRLEVEAGFVVDVADVEAMTLSKVGKFGGSIAQICFGLYIYNFYI